MYELWYDHVKPKYSEKSKLCYMDTGNFIVHVEADGIYKDITEDLEKTFLTSNHELDKALTDWIKKKKAAIKPMINAFNVW